MRRKLYLLIDADVLRYLFAFKNTAVVDWGDGESSEVLQPERAKAQMEEYVADLVDRFGADDFLLPLSCKKHNFRKDVEPTYKQARHEKAKPTLWAVLDEYMRELWPDKIIEIANLEGDDVLGLLASHPNPKRAPGARIVCSIDKDLQTVPCRLFNPNKPALGTRTITVKDANLFWMTQAITGDTTDNYKGLPGAGYKCASELLGPIHERFLEADDDAHLDALWTAVVKLYETKKPRGGDEPLGAEEALKQARLARILRYGDYSPKSGVKLWKP